MLCAHSLVNTHILPVQSRADAHFRKLPQRRAVPPKSAFFQDLFKKRLLGIARGTKLYHPARQLRLFFEEVDLFFRPVQR